MNSLEFELKLLTNGIRNACLIDKEVQKFKFFTIPDDFFVLYLCGQIHIVKREYIEFIASHGTDADVVFAKKACKQPQSASTSERDEWIRRVKTQANVIVSKLKSKIDVISLEFDELVICPISFSGMVISYPVVYDLQGPYGPEIVEGRLDDTNVHCLNGVSLALTTAVFILGGNGSVSVGFSVPFQCLSVHQERIIAWREKLKYSVAKSAVFSVSFDSRTFSSHALQL
jgi:hypothetical protein